MALDPCNPVRRVFRKLAHRAPVHHRPVARVGIVKAAVAGAVAVGVGCGGVAAASYWRAYQEAASRAGHENSAEVQSSPVMGSGLLQTIGPGLLSSAVSGLGYARSPAEQPPSFVPGFAGPGYLAARPLARIPRVLASPPAEDVPRDYLALAPGYEGGGFTDLPAIDQVRPVIEAPDADKPASAVPEPASLILLAVFVFFGVMLG